MRCGFRFRGAGGAAAVVAAALVAAPPAMAGQADESAGDNEPPARRMLVSRALCRQLQADARGAQGPEYTPGVDVHGDPVVPAEGPRRRQRVVPEVFVLPLDVDPLKGSAESALGLAGSLSLGRLLIGPDGRVLYDGRPLGPEAEARLRRACRRAGGAGL